MSKSKLTYPISIAVTIAVVWLSEPRLKDFALITFLVVLSILIYMFSQKNTIRKICIYWDADEKYVTKDIEIFEPLTLLQYRFIKIFTLGCFYMYIKGTYSPLSSFLLLFFFCLYALNSGSRTDTEVFAVRTAKRRADEAFKERTSNNKPFLF